MEEVLDIPASHPAPATAPFVSRYTRWQPPAVAAPSAGGSDYDRTVDELASRGFTLGALLEFLCILLERTVMPSFDPDTSTTEDIAYGAAVPLSEGGPYARIMTCGQRCYPKCLITHSWANVFCHTVAAAVADAMGTRCFFHLIPRLRTPGRVRKLMDDIARMRGDRLVAHTYWFCALSINQHRVGCHNQNLCGRGHLLKFSGKVLDTPRACTGAACLRPLELGEAIFACPACGVVLCAPCKRSFRKVCSCDGRAIPAGSDLCEVDKFDQMMVRLEGIHGDFYHVVALDKAGRALTRTWVVAEIAQAQRDRLKQKIQSFFPLRLSRREIVDGILNIDVRKSEASNPGDTDMILAKIDDKDEYNDAVRHNLLQGLKPSILDMCASALVAVLGGVFIFSVMWVIFSAPNGHWCKRHSCREKLIFLVPTVYAIVLVISHVEYGAVCADIRACRGLRRAALQEADRVVSTRCQGVLWGLQRWYVRQSAEWDATDGEVLPQESRPPAGATLTWLFDLVANTILRGWVVVWTSWSVGVLEDAFEMDFTLILDPVCTFVIVASILSYDVAVQERSVEGLVLLLLLATACLVVPFSEYCHLCYTLLPVPLGLLICTLFALCLHRSPCCAARRAKGGPGTGKAGRRDGDGPSATVDVQEAWGVVP